MAPNVKDVLCAPIIRLDTVDSTNNRAAQYIDADTAVDGLTVVSKEQTAGKGQRGHVWKDEVGSALLMSLLLVPERTLDQQFAFSCAVAVATAETLADLEPGLCVRIKFPNDIIINDKKAGGILIENSLRGSQWTHAIVGVGINLLQTQFPPELPHATSLLLACGRALTPDQLLPLLRERIIRRVKSGENLLSLYNQLLFRAGRLQRFRGEAGVWSATVLRADAAGNLWVRRESGEEYAFPHGRYEWIW